MPLPAALLGALGRVAGSAGAFLEGAGARGAIAGSASVGEGGFLSRLLRGLGFSGTGSAKVGGIIPDGLAEKAKKLGGTLNNMGAHLVQAQFATQAAGSAFTGLTKILVPMAPLVKGVTAGLNLFVGAVTSIGDSVAGFVGLASPVHVQKFKLATDDLVATIGHMLLPVMEYGTELVRAFADALTPLKGSAKELMESLFKPMTALMPTLANAGAAVSRAMGSAVRAVTPIINIFGSWVEIFGKIVGTGIEILFHSLAINLELLGDVMKPLLGWMERGTRLFAEFMSSIIESVRSFFGLPKDVSGSSTGAAARPATFSSVEDYGRKAQQAAFSLGTANDPAKDSAMTLHSIYDLLERAGGQLVKTIGDLPAKIAEAIRRELPNPAAAVRIATGGGFGLGFGASVGEAARDFFRGTGP